MLISIDHGNKQIKTTNCKPFTSGLAESATRPFGQEVLQYKGRYYTLVDERIPYRRDKTEDERFFILTLFAIARELRAREIFTEQQTISVQLAIGLPPAHYGSQYRRFEAYFMDRGPVEFTYGGRPVAIEITNAACFPQAYAAAVTMFQSLAREPKALIVDIGGFTADYLFIKYGAAQLGTCDSLENGVIVLYNRISSKVYRDLDILLEEGDIDAILQGSPYPLPVVTEAVQLEAESFVSDLFSTLRERKIEPRSSKVVFTGGGAILLREYIQRSDKVGQALFVEDISANARGYEILYRVASAKR